MAVVRRWSIAAARACAVAAGLVALVCAPVVVHHVRSSAVTSSAQHVAVAPAAQVAADSAEAAAPEAVPVSSAAAPAASITVSGDEVTQAIANSPLTAGVPASEYQVIGLMQSRTQEDWVRATLVSKTVGDAVVVLKHEDHTWKLMEIGSYQVGCETAPKELRSEWNLTCDKDFG